MSGPIYLALGSFPTVKGDTLPNDYSVQLNSSFLDNVITKLDTGLCGGTWLRDNADLERPSPSVLAEAEGSCRHGQ